MKIVLTLVILLSMMIAGCSEPTKVETPPWSEAQVKAMEYEDINVVPFFIVRY